MDKLEVKIIADGYRDILVSTDRHVVAKTISIILESEEQLSPEERRIMDLQRELEQLKDEKRTAESMSSHYRNELKKAKEAAAE